MPRQMIGVGPEMAKRLREEFERFNRKAKEKTGKEMTFADFTDLASKVFDMDKRTIIIKPIKKGRKSRLIEAIPI